MKKIKFAALVLAMMILLSVFTGCGSVKWDDIKNKDVVATVNGTEITKQHVAYQYAEDYASNEVSKNLFTQMGVADKIENDTSMDNSFRKTMAYYVIGDLARENGFGLTEDEAYEKAYQEFVLMAKKPGYEYITEYNNTIKEMLYFDDDMMVDYGSQKIYNSNPSTYYILSLMEEMQYDYPEETDPKEEQLKAAVAEYIADQAKTLDIELNYHSKKTIAEFDYADIVNKASTTFNRAEKK